MAAYSSSAMPSAVVPVARYYGQQTKFVCYTGTFSASVSDEIQMLKLPRNAIVDRVYVGGNVAATVASLLVGDDAGSKSRFGTVSLSNAAAPLLVLPNGLDYHYSLSDDDQFVTILLTASAQTSASGSCSINMQVVYHMP